MMSFVPLTHRVKRIAGRSRGLAEAAAEVVVLAPSEVSRRSRAIYLPGQLDKIVAAQADTSIAHELQRIDCSKVVHDPTLAFRLVDAQLLGGTLFAAGTMHQMVGRHSPRIRGRTQQRIEDTVALVGTPVSDLYFGHRVVDDNVTALMAAEFGLVCHPKAVQRPDWPHVRAYGQALGTTCHEIGDVDLSEAWVFQDHGMTDHRRQRMKRLRDRLRLDTGGGQGVVITRGSSGQARRLRNEGEIVDMLCVKGFEVVDPQRDDLGTIRQKLSNASTVVGVEGSALAHALLLGADDMMLLTIQPPSRFNNLWKDFTDLMGMHYGFVVAEGQGEDFTVDCDDILRTLDLRPVTSPWA
ncbi:glycosyltransferase 61 family protein [Paracoccus sp. PARArs4]|uniref:glycosyltransferase 61 family protein n=1 Tax=Paracoccus sp. PARArs4 TaxID=2853442 RepID=UPI0024A773CD|nr:glycosyltransferase 61 family protein [Paracoccus sp. PARArs4]